MQCNYYRCLSVYYSIVKGTLTFRDIPVTTTGTVFSCGILEKSEAAYYVGMMGGEDTCPL